jgi:DNA-binding XRE family transcriptional regulator
MEQNALDLENKMLQTEALKVYDDAYFMSQIELADEVNVNNDRLSDIEREREAKKLKEVQEREQLVFDTKLGLASQATSAILANMEQGSNAYKAVAAAQVVFDTYRGIQATFASAAVDPMTAFFPAKPYIQAGIAATFGFANVRKILSSSPAKASGGVSAPSTGGGSGAFGGSLATPSAQPQINMFGKGFEGGTVTADKRQTYKVEVNANEISAAMKSNVSQSNFASL